MSTLKILTISTSALTFTLSTAWAAAPHVVITPTGAPEIVYSYVQDHCDLRDVPDNPARAFKNAQGQNVLVFGNAHGYHYTTAPALAAPLNHDCNSNMLSSPGANRNANPTSYYNALWIVATWTTDGNTIYALVHNEYHPPGIAYRNGAGYWNMISAVSTDGGHTFKLNTYPNGTPIPTIATPVRYDAQGSRLQGIVAETNIIHSGQYEYLLATGVINGKPIKGMCLYRTNNMADPTAWRAWDGKGFNIASINPYQQKVSDVNAYTCTPVLPLPGLHYAWTYNTLTHQYIAIGKVKNHWNNGVPRGQWVLAYAYSSDMIHWSHPYYLTTMPEDTSSVTAQLGPGKSQYYSLLDPNSAGMNFEQSGDHLYLYYTYGHPQDSQYSVWNRDLVRQPLTINFSQ